jgi:hypothetical protein
MQLSSVYIFWLLVCFEYSKIHNSFFFMSNHTPHSHHEDDPISWNTSQLFKIIWVVWGLVTMSIASSEIRKSKEQSQDATISPIMQAIVDNKSSFQGLPIIQIWNQEEIHTLKSTGKDGLYVFQRGNTLTYWKMQSGIIV